VTFSNPTEDKSLANGRTMDFEDEPCELQLPLPPPSRSGSRTPRKPPQQAPQETVKQFWEQFNTKYPGKVFTVLPDNPYARSKVAQLPRRNSIIQGYDAVKSYEQARKECERSVKRLVRECKRVNQKYSDPHFDIEFDLKTGRRDCLDGLDVENPSMRPKGVKRVTVCRPFFFYASASCFCFCSHLSSENVVYLDEGKRNSSIPKSTNVAFSGV